ncbi:MAG: uncharacterized protein KVP18_003687 [Porospora cf. gigantea A]|uniref:uncharacterized protein n=1 Tax=Porospora cf. gigantea A TaxID=2853593 RepID=UPI0035595C0B|nr:MAG: hypothetical protein KVP18_003687 [Porospora cf. gigantea A]
MPISWSRLTDEAISLSVTLQSGQIFSWEQIDVGAVACWVGFIGSCLVALRENDGIQYAALSSASTCLHGDLYKFFRLDVECPHWNPLNAAHSAALARCRGLRLLRQEPLECLFAFILSSLNNVKRITSLVHKLKHLSTPVKALGRSWHPFPSVETLAAVSEVNLRAQAFGYRSRYVVETSEILRSGNVDLLCLLSMPLTDARSYLMKLPGVGQKVADCVLLYSFGFDTVPVDVHIYRMACRDFKLPHTTLNRRAVNRVQEAFAKQYPEEPGWAQLLLFHAERL